MTWRKKPPRASRAERWQREDTEPRLAELVPRLQALRLEFEELSNGIGIPGTRRARPFIVERAAALFEVPCGNERCQEGGYDLTNDLMFALRAGREELEGEQRCLGRLEQTSSECGRALHFRMQARFAPDDDKAT